MEKQKYIIHVGYPKSGSTTLQRHVFPHLHALYNAGWQQLRDDIGKSATLKQDENVSRAQSEILENDNLKEWYGIVTQTKDTPETKSKIHIQTQQVFYDIAQKARKPILISNERFTDTRGTSLREKAERLKDLFPQAEIIIVVRSQVDFIRSLYDFTPYDPRVGEYPRTRKVITFEEFVDIWLSTEYLRSSIQFNAVVHMYQELFDGHITVVPFEGLFALHTPAVESFARAVYEKPEYVSHILRRKHENEASSIRLHTVRKAYYMLSSGLPLHRVLPLNVKNFLIGLLNYNSPQYKTQVAEYPELVQKIKETYAQGNTLLDEEMSLGLKRYGYY